MTSSGRGSQGVGGREGHGALPRLSQVARRALTFVGVLALIGAGFLVAQAFLLASVLASVVDGRTEGLQARLVALACVVVGRALVVWATRVVSQRAAAGVKEELRERAVGQALRRGPEWIAGQGPGELAALTTRGLDALDAYFTQYLPALVTASVVPPAAGVAVLFADWPSAVIVALTVPLLPVFAILVGKHTELRVRDSLDAMRRLSGQLLELVRVLPVLSAFGRAGAQAESVSRVSERHRAAAVGSMKVAFSSALVLDLLATLSVALVAVVVGVRLVSGDLPLAIGLGVLILVPECYQPIRAVGAAFHASEDGVEAVRRVLDLGRGTECWPAWCRECSGRLEPALPLTRGGRPAHLVRVEGLRVARRDASTVSFDARPGVITWLRAPSGGGKSTALAALLGFVRPSAGSITVGGKPLDGLDPRAWRRNVAWVPQFPVLSEATVRAELAAADVDAVSAELDIAHLLDRDPRKLSTGERQRVALARALLRIRHEGAWLLLLDEPTAHLDAANAARVLAAVQTAADAGAAVVLAAHAGAGSGSGSGSRELWGESIESRELWANPAAPTPAPPDGGPVPARDLVGSRLLAGAGLGALGWIAGLALAVTSAWLIAKASQQPPLLTLTVAIVGVRAFGLGRSTLRYVERIATHDAAFRLATRLRVELWRALVRLGPARSLAAGDAQLRLVDDVDTVRDLVPRVLTPPLVVAAVAGFAVAVQTLVLPEAGAVLAAALLVGGLGSTLLSRGVERRATALAAESRRTVGAMVLTLFDAAAELIAFDRAGRRRAELAEADARLASLARRSALASGLAEALIIATTDGAAVACAILAAGAVTAGALDPVLAPVLALLPLALAEVVGLLPEVARHAESLRRARSRLGAVLAGRREGHLWDVQCPEGALHGTTLDGVTVRWPDAGEPALQDVSLHVRRGRWVAVVGPSGAGKSTLLATLLGFLTPERGTAKRRPDAVVWAPQEPYLCSTSIAENLRLGDPHATDEAMADALRTVCLDEYADRLDLVLSSAGTGLSGGQAGRLSLARALLAARRHGPNALVLLDEPTAHLDAATAATVLRNLRAELAGHAVVHVTHRADEAADAEQVLEVRDRRVHELASV